MVLPASPPASRHASLLLKLSLTKPQSTGKASVSSPSIVTLQHGRGQAPVPHGCEGRGGGCPFTQTPREVQSANTTV